MVTDDVKDALAVYRLTRLVIADEITAGVRDKIWETHPPETSKIGYLFTCPWCTSIWVGFAVAAARKIAPAAWDLASTALAGSAVAGLIEERRR